MQGSELVGLFALRGKVGKEGLFDLSSGPL